MAKAVRITIAGPRDDRIDAPTVDDMVGQIRDFIEILRGVERAVEADGNNQLVWRVTDAQMNSPICFEFTPEARGPVEAIAARIDAVEQAAFSGLSALRRGDIRPPYFTDEVLGKARRLYARTLNGLSGTTIEFEGKETAPILIDRLAAKDFERAEEEAKALDSWPYREIGSVEGYVTKPELDGHNRAVLRFRSRLDGSEVKAFAGGDAFHQVEQLRLSDVWHGVRVRVYGLIHYKRLGEIEVINATGIEVLDRDKLPGMYDIIDPDFAKGMTTEEFLAEQRREDA